MITTEGGLEILNVGMGDMKITFDKDNATEVESARRLIEMMMRRGFALMVALPGRGKRHVRVQKFDPAKGTYHVTLPPDLAALLDNEVDALPAIVDGAQPASGDSAALAAIEALRDELKRDKAELLAMIEGRQGAHAEMPARRVKAVAIGRSAGG